jgi:hypothetical protein
MLLRSTDSRTSRHSHDRAVGSDPLRLSFSYAIERTFIPHHDMRGPAIGHGAGLSDVISLVSPRVYRMLQPVFGEDPFWDVR